MTKRPIDRRAARSRTMLHQALLSLIAKKDYDAITVEDICETANVGRSTFYGHFAGKDDLKRAGLEHLREELKDLRKNVANPAEERALVLGFSLAMFEHGRDHVHLYRALAGNRGGAIALSTIRQILGDCVRGELVARGNRPLKDSVSQELVVRYVVGAYMAVLTWWLDGGAEMPPSEIDAIFQGLATEGIDSIYS